MNKPLLLSLTAAVAAVFSAGAENQTLTLTFNRPDNTVDVAGVVTTATGIDGVTASLTAVSPSLRAQGTSKSFPLVSLLHTRNSNSNELTAANPNIWTFSLSSLPENWVISAVAVTFDGLTEEGTSQPNRTTSNRNVDVDVLCGADVANLQSFAGISNTDLVTNGTFIDDDGNEMAQTGNYASNGASWEAGARRLSKTTSLPESTLPKTASSMALQIKLWKGASNGAGCVYGISKIELTLSDPAAHVENYKHTWIDKLSNIAVLGDEVVTSTINGVEIADDASIEESKSKIDDAVNSLWDRLGGKVYTFKNMPTTDAYADYYLSTASNSENRVVVAQNANTNAEAWFVERVGDDSHNAFYLKNVATGTYISREPIVSGDTKSVCHTADADKKAAFTFVAYTNTTTHVDCIAIKCINPVEATQGYSYLQCPAGLYSDRTEVNTAATTNWWFNRVEPDSNYDETHPSAFKGRWLMAKAPDEIATSISEIAVETKSAEGIYDLSGRRLSVPTKGICIINGRKTLVK